MEKNSKIYIAGHKGLAGSAIKKILENKGYQNLIYRDSSELDLRESSAVEEFFEKEKPQYVFLAAAKIGSIKSNMTFPAEFIKDNLQIQLNVINSSWKSGVKKLLNISCSCAYPTKSLQPIKEEYLLSGIPEPTNEAFAVAKIAGIKMCQAYSSQYGANFISVIPSNIYGPNDCFDSERAHIIGQTMNLIQDAKDNNLERISLGGTGKPVRDFLYSEDLADACLFLMNNYNSSNPINIGTKNGYTKKEVAEKIKKVMEFEGDIIFDESKPDGMLKRIVSTDKINSLGWNSKTSLEEGLKRTYDWFLKNKII